MKFSLKANHTSTNYPHLLSVQQALCRREVEFKPSENLPGKREIL